MIHGNDCGCGIASVDDVPKGNSSVFVGGFEFGLLVRMTARLLQGVHVTCDNRYLKYVTNNVSYEKIRNFDPLNIPLPRFLGVTCAFDTFLYVERYCIYDSTGLLGGESTNRRKSLVVFCCTVIGV
jgi:hypothetical protein